MTMPQMQSNSQFAALSQAEQNILIEYQKTSENLKELADKIQRLNAVPSRQLSESLQALEQKLELVLTCLKSSVYSVFVENPDKFKIDLNQGPEEDISMAD